MRFLTLTFAILATLTQWASAQQPPLVVTDAGYYYVVVDSQGVPSLEPVEQVMILVADGAPSPPKPDDPTTPDNPTLTARQEQIRQWALAVGDFDNAQALALVYEKMADGLDAGDLTVSNVWDAVKMASDVALASAIAQEQWKEFRESRVGELIAKLMAQGKLGTASAVSELLRDIQIGLQHSVPLEASSLSPGVGIALLGACDKIIQKIKGN